MYSAGESTRIPCTIKPKLLHFPDWPGHCKHTVGQSPIEIEGTDLGAGNHPSVTDIELINYDMNVSIIVENTGYGCKLWNVPFYSSLTPD